jgi:hypothetical protein
MCIGNGNKFKFIRKLKAGHVVEVLFLKALKETGIMEPEETAVAG